MRRRAILWASLFLLPVFTTLSPDATHPGPTEAHASVSVLLSLDEIVRASTAVVVGTAGERKSQWEEVGGSKRIVTYTKVKIDRTLAGSPGTEVWVRTLGGTVDNIGQAVSGEARIATGSKSVLFLAKRGEITAVVGMAQGHFPLQADDKGITRLRPSPDVGKQVRTPGPTISARDVLIGKTLEAAATSILEARKAIDEKKK